MTKPTFGSYFFTSSAATGMPDATCSGRVGQFIVIGLAGLDFQEPFTVQWSAIGDPNDFPTPGTTDARTKQSGQQVLSAKHGKVTGITEGDFFGYVFQQNAITRMTYIGGDVVFSFETFEFDRGCIDYDRFTQIDDFIFFESEYGRHMLLENQITDIGRGIVDKTYPPIIDKTACVASNPSLNAVFFKRDGTVDSSNTHTLVYNYRTNQWSYSVGYSPALVWWLYTVTDPDAGIGLVMKPFGGNGDVADYTDASVANGATTQQMVFSTAYFEPSPGQLTNVDGVRVRPYDGSPAVAVKTKDRLTSTTPSLKTGTLNSRTNMYNFRNGNAQSANARYLSLDVEYTIGASVGPITGADLKIITTGMV
jgi:hypothetical protein